jgi:hypothetical protein
MNLLTTNLWPAVVQVQPGEQTNAQHAQRHGGQRGRQSWFNFDCHPERYSWCAAMLLIVRRLMSKVRSRQALKTWSRTSCGYDYCGLRLPQRLHALRLHFCFHPPVNPLRLDSFRPVAKVGLNHYLAMNFQPYIDTVAYLVLRAASYALLNLGEDAALIALMFC